MTELQQYLAEEVAEDLSDGIITRRDAMRRLALMGITGAAATGLLAAAASPAAAAPKAKRPASKGPARGLGSTDDWGPVATQAITFAGPRGTLMGAWAPADGRAKGSVLVIHENRGLNDHTRSVAGRFAASGWSALALDLLSEEGGTAAVAANGGDAAVSAALAAVADPTRFDDDMKAAVTELRRRVPRKPVNAIGFCFGGGMVWRLLAAGERRLAAAAPFYGPFPEGGNLRGARAAVLGVYGGLDARVNATRDAAKAALVAARLEHQILTFTPADHAFFNDTGARFNAPASQEAWSRVLAWFAASHKR
jgi:carboxymethylenebutenolidase